MTLRFKLVFLLFVSVLLFSACTLERKLAKEFIKQKKEHVAVMLVQPFSLDMYNNTEYYLDSIDIPADYPLDSLLFQQTKLLKELSDSVFLENYINGFINRLRKSGFQVFLPNELDAFKEVEASAYIFKMAQIELSEELYPYLLSEEISGEDYHKIFDLNLIKLNNWFEFEARDTAWRKVFYAEDAIMDDFSGDVLIDEIKKIPILYYTIDSLSVVEVYQMATDVGEKYAGFLIDYLMNTYIEQNFLENFKPNLYFHYDAENRMLFYSADEERFLEISK